MLGFVRISAAVPSVRVAGIAINRDAALSLIARAHGEGAQVVVFPELSLAGYTSRDLFLDRTLLDQVQASLGQVVEASAGLSPLVLVGLPLRTSVGIYNVAAVLQGGQLLGLVPKSYLPNYREFEERRWFRPGTEVADGATLRLLGRDVPFGTDLLFTAEGIADFVVGVEICEDMFVQTPPHAGLVSAGATVVCNLSASNFLVGKAELRKLLCASASDRGKCAYLYVAAGPSESSTDVAFDAHAFVYENGSLLAESPRFTRESKLLLADVDLDQLAHERDVTNTFGDCASEHKRVYRRIAFRAQEVDTLARAVVAHPFVPKDPSTLAARCWETFEIQTNALATRLSSIGPSTKLVLGLSGGLDSTHAALVAANALDLLGRPRADLVCVTMPGFGSSNETQSNAEKLAGSLSASFQRIGIAELSRAVLAAFGHPAAAPSVDELLALVRKQPELADLSFENVQARMRTLLLMSVANRERGIVVGTGDLSEKALGWSTYAGDQISMYDVNAGVPKTLIQYLIRWVANERATTWVSGDTARLREILFAILETPISPELLPPDADGKIAQLTEAHLGPYELHDFFLYHFVRHGRRPSRILGLATLAFGERYTRADIKRWLTLFFRRFFANQFKRSCTPDGPKVGNVALSPRGDWRMPSDADVTSWLAELEA
ncbi:MAG: Glutamine-dependent synthetase [Pseudomonadota bacterium]|jgi:NAD+ synthase (glutamine-hydrolysing)